MKNKGFVISWTMAAVLFGVMAVGVASRYFLKKADNQVEEFCERLIHQETGVDIDLSPGSPEGHKGKLDLTRTTR